jgi:hypothetical protein
MIITSITSQAPVRNTSLSQVILCVVAVFSIRLVDLPYQNCLLKKKFKKKVKKGEYNVPLFKISFGEVVAHPVFFTLHPKAQLRGL